MAVTNDLVTDRRVLRHAATLREAGYEVTLIGRKDLHVRSKRTWRFYAEYNLRLCWRLLRTRCDIVWANDTDTLPACWMAARLKGRRLVMDSHELFPEVPELIERPRVKRVWERIEGLLLPRCDANMTVCQSIADYYRTKYGVEMTVVRNLWSDECGVMSDEECGMRNGEFAPLRSQACKAGRKVKGEGSEVNPEGELNTMEKKEKEVKKGERFTLLYQGAVNKGRGVDWAIDVLEFLPDCRLVVAGGGDLLEEMKAYAQSKPWAERIVFTGRLTPEELEPLTRQAAVGLVMLEDMGLSYHFALPNRIGDFVAAGVPIVVSDLPEMAAVVKRFGVGEIINKVNPEGELNTLENKDNQVKKGERSEVKGERLKVKGERLKVKGERLKVKGERSEVKGERLEVNPEGELNTLENKDNQVKKGERLEVKGSMGKNDPSTYQRINVIALAEAVRKVLAKEWKEEDFAAARADMDWNKEKRKLLECLKKVEKV